MQSQHFVRCLSELFYFRWYFTSIHFIRVENMNDTLGQRSLSIAPPRRLRDAVQPSHRAPDGREINIYPGLYQRGSDQPDGFSIRQILLDLRKCGPPVERAHQRRQMPRSRRVLNQAEQIASMGAAIDDAQHLILCPQFCNQRIITYRFRRDFHPHPFQLRIQMLRIGGEFADIFQALSEPVLFGKCRLSCSAEHNARSVPRCKGLDCCHAGAQQRQW